jgi:glycosyltransferase involved in cell wall biosynthesis
VCIPAYNNAPFVATTIESVLTQTYPHLELVIADHGSVDGTWERLQRYAADLRVRLLRTPAGGGPEANWNTVTSAARGIYVKLVCGDDPLHPLCIARQVEAMERHPGVVLVAAKRDIIDAHGHVLYRGHGLGRLDGRVSGPVAIRATVRAGTNIFGEPSSVLMRADALRAAGPWSDRLLYLTDEDMWVRLLLDGDFYALRKPLSTFRLQALSLSCTLAADQARQTIEFQRRLRQARPDVVSAVDEWIGAGRAVVNAWARRLIYATLRSRLVAPAGPPPEARPVAGGAV